MIYSLIYSKKFLNQIEKLNKEMQLRVINSLERIRIRPHSYIKKLVGNKYFSLRVGSYRIILDINNGKLKILVMEIGHRRNIYK